MSDVSRDGRSTARIRKHTAGTCFCNASQSRGCGCSPTAVWIQAAGCLRALCFCCTEVGVWILHLGGQDVQQLKCSLVFIVDFRFQFCFVSELRGKKQMRLPHEFWRNHCTLPTVVE
jgi:hypothetical protein